MNQFTDVIETREQLRKVLKEPSEHVTRKVLKYLDKHCGSFIAKSPFVLLASADASGNVDVSPKGDPIGFVKVLDKYTLAIPDRPGNNRVDSLENIIQNNKVGLIFLIPGKKETLRVSGTAIIVRDKNLRDSLSVKGRSPKIAIVVKVEEAFFHCSKCMIRSKLWEHDDWPDLSGLPRLAETMVNAGNLEISEKEMHEIVKQDERDELY
jgi:PPOX class probable FMN-dependent enzyme